MRQIAVIEVQTDTLAEQQFILNRFPHAMWIALDENKTRFYIQYPEYAAVRNAINEWEKANE